MTRHRDHVLQPEGFRAEDDVPEWVHFPRLHLLLGWGPGIWETIDAGIAGLRHVFLPADPDRHRPPIASVIDWRDRYYMYSKLREQAPALVIEGVGPRNVRYDLGDGGVTASGSPCARGAMHPVVPDGEYAVRHAFEDGDAILTLARKTRVLKAEHRAKLESLGRTPDAAPAFAAYASRIKAAYAERRVKELLKEPAKRPADFAERMAARARSRMGEMERRKRDGRGRPKLPYPQDELARCTCVEIARLEATDLMFDCGFKDVCVLSSAGVRLIA